MANKQIVVKLGADTSEIKSAMQTVKSSTKKATDGMKKGFDDTGTSSKKSGGMIKNAFSGLGGILASAFAVKSVLGFGKSVIEAAASAQVMEAQFSQSFKGVEGVGNQMLEDLSSKFNILPDRLKAPMATFQSYFKGAGASAKEAGDMTETSMNIAADGAAMYGLSLEDTQGSLKSFLMGNYEAGDAIRVNTNATKVAKAYNEDYGGSFDDLNEAQKQNYLLEYVEGIYALNGAMGQGQREGHEYENVLENLKSAWSTFLGGLGEAALPLAVGLMENLTKWIQGIDTKALVGGFKTFGSYVKDVLWPIIESVIGIVESLWETFKDVGGLDLAQGALEGLGTALETLQSWMSAIDTEALITGFTAVSDFLIELLTPAVEGAVAVIETLWEKFKESGAIDTAKEALDGVKETLDGFNFDEMAASMQAFIDKWLPLIAGVTAAAAAYGVYALALGVYSLALGIKSAVETVAIISMYAMGAAGSFLAGVMAILTSPIFLVVLAIGALVAIGVYLWQNWDTIGAKAGEIFGAMGEFFAGVWESIKTKILEVWGSITTWLSTTWESIKTAGVNTWTAFKDFFVTLWESIKTFISTVWEGIKAVFTTVVAAIVTYVKDYFTNLKKNIATIFEAVKLAITTVWDGIKAVFKTVIDFIVTFVKDKFENMKRNITTIFDTIKSTISTVWESIKTKISTLVDSIKTKVKTTFDTMKTNIKTVFDAIKTKITDTWDTIKTNVKLAVDAVKTKVTDTFTTLKSTVTDIWDDIKSAISDPIEDAKEAVKTAIDKIKGFMDFEWSLPSLKMPHISISGDFDLNPLDGDGVSAPKFGIDWYASGGIATGPSVVGVGEAGDEAILPLSNKSKMKPFANAVASMMPAMTGGGEPTGAGTVITGNTFQIREEADIKKVAQELFKLQKRHDRSKGRGN